MSRLHGAVPNTPTGSKRCDIAAGCAGARLGMHVYCCIPIPWEVYAYAALRDHRLTLVAVTLTYPDEAVSCPDVARPSSTAIATLQFRVRFAAVVLSPRCNPTATEGVSGENGVIAHVTTRSTSFASSTTWMAMT